MNHDIEISYCTWPQNKDLHKVKPIGNLYEKYISLAKKINANAIIVDPFAKDCLLGDFRNDLNVNTVASFHLDAAEFLMFLYKKKIRADVVIFDPPFSRAQNKRTYGNHRKDLDKTITLCKQILPIFVRLNGFVIASGWTANGVGSWRGFEKEELLIVNHGYNRYSTSVLVERKVFEPKHVKWIEYFVDKEARKNKNRQNVEELSLSALAV